MDKLKSAKLHVVTLLSVVIPALLLGILRPLGSDESIFLYGGRIINLGLTPYVDLFDHKGPLLYFLNSVGLKITLPNLSGVVLIQALFICIALILVLESYFRNFEASNEARKYLLFLFLVVSSIFSTIHTFGTTELWALPFQLSSYALVTRKLLRISLEKKLKPNFLIDNEIFIAFILGSSFIVNFLIRPNNSIGILFVCLVNIIYSKKKFIKIKIIAVYLTSVLIIIFLMRSQVDYFDSRQLSLIFEQYILYNSNYSDGLSVIQKIYGSSMLLINFVKLPVFLTLIFVLSVIKINSSKTSILFFLLSVFTIDFMSQLISGRGVSAYLVAILASIFNIIAFILQNFEFKENLLNVIAGVSVILLVSNLSVDSFAARWHDNFRNQIQASEYLSRNTTLSDKVFYLGNNPSILVRANRTSASKVIYIAPLLSSFYSNREKLVSETLDELTADKPVYVVQNVENSCGLSEEKCYDLNSQYLPENLAIPNIRKFVRENYELESIVGGEIFYRLIE